MKKLFILLLAACAVLATQSCKKSSPATASATAAFENVIPKPASATATGMAFFITKETTVIADGETLSNVAEYLAGKLNPATGFGIKVKQGAISATPESGAIYLSTNGGKAELGDEGYELTIAEDHIRIIANKPAGVFYGVQTLRQLLPSEIEQATVQSTPWEVAVGTISDSPDYAWRGSMLDVARHFFTVEDVKQYIDYISMYKMNVLHLHLSDDQGWRIEIKSWPKLATHGGTLEVGGGKGGYYSQEDYKDIVAYAERKFVTIVPEIDLPGHINSALASYGELNGGITIVPEAGRVNSLTKGDLDGKDKPTQLYTGTEVGFSTLQLKKEATFRFVDDVIRELAAMTPGEFIHIGGDEAKVTKKEDYKIFIGKFEEIVKSHGKKMIGWEEIAQGNIKGDFVAQHWHSTEYATAAVEKGGKVLMSPATKVYMDMQYDSASKLGLHWAAYIEVDSSYLWDPATEALGVAKEDIVGVEAPLWSETISTMSDIQYLLFPRIAGVAEIGWTPTASRNWDNYKVRLGNQAKRWKAMNIDYYKSTKVTWVE